MLSHADAIATIGVKNLKAAREFYENKLGFKPIKGEMSDEVQMYKCGNTKVEIYRSDYAGSNLTTVLSWAVENVKNEVEELKNKGVRFEHYAFPQTKLIGDIHHMGEMRVAWFKDPDGNILSITNQ